VNTFPLKIMSHKVCAITVGLLGLFGVCGEIVWEIAGASFYGLPFHRIVERISRLCTPFHLPITFCFYFL